MAMLDLLPIKNFRSKLVHHKLRLSVNNASFWDSIIKDLIYPKADKTYQYFTIDQKERKEIIVDTSGTTETENDDKAGFEIEMVLSRNKVVFKRKIYDIYSMLGDYGGFNGMMVWLSGVVFSFLCKPGLFSSIDMVNKHF